MRIGMIATEFPPRKGGMEEHAGTMARWLDEDDELIVVTRDGLGIELKRGRVIHGLKGIISHDAKILQSQHVDCWIAMSASLIALAPMVSDPMYGYVHGLDCIRPWMPHHPLLEHTARFTMKIGISLDNLIYKWRRQQIRTGLRSLRGVFSNSSYTADLFSLAYKYPLNSIRVVHPGVNEDFLKVEHKLQDSIFRLLLISRLDPNARRKNINGVIEAIALIALEIEIFLHVVGTGRDLDYLKKLASKLGVGDRVAFEGAASQSDVECLFARADAFILAVKPTENDVEGFGMVYAEAACAGLPSIAVNTGGVSEAVEDGKTGVLLKDASPISIASAITQFAQNRSQFDTAYIRAYGRERTSKQTTRQLRNYIGNDLAASASGT